MCLVVLYLQHLQKKSRTRRMLLFVVLRKISISAARFRLGKLFPYVHQVMLIRTPVMCSIGMVYLEK
ncbi:hypothetical protein NZ35_05450 [Pseudomonas chlororaphis]|uniref:Uncharacterized protein n=1 Tax=Pseudomonas chlororaphis TaxID=587753 RepID=A0A0A6DJ05_9PSED|nr:hypothetical protein NZ35_05450 [Pseudomonas chlororaphis]